MDSMIFDAGILEVFSFRTLSQTAFFSGEGEVPRSVEVAETGVETPEIDIGDQLQSNLGERGEWKGNEGEEERRKDELVTLG